MRAFSGVAVCCGMVGAFVRRTVFVVLDCLYAFSGQ